jgi:hypothetical protein
MEIAGPVRGSAGPGRCLLMQDDEAGKGAFAEPGQMAEQIQEIHQGVLELRDAVARLTEVVSSMALRG